MTIMTQNVWMRNMHRNIYCSESRNQHLIHNESNINILARLLCHPCQPCWFCDMIILLKMSNCNMRCNCILMVQDAFDYWCQHLCCKQYIWWCVSNVCFFDKIWHFMQVKYIISIRQRFYCVMISFHRVIQVRQ